MAAMEYTHVISLNQDQLSDHGLHQFLISQYLSEVVRKLRTGFAQIENWMSPLILKYLV
jgi:hypothetical protein